eukprot:3142174-Amphidinium_carterae.1
MHPCHGLQAIAVPKHGIDSARPTTHSGAYTPYTLWFLVCVLLAAPGVFYSAVKAVPGFLQVSGFARWLVSSAVALSSGVVTGFGLPFLAGHLSGRHLDRTRLQLLGLLLASILLPCRALSTCTASPTLHHAVAFFVLNS